MEAPSKSGKARFGVYEVDLRAGELRKHGLKIKLQDQPFQVLAMLLEHPGEVVTREELRQKLWLADTFVDFDVGLNTAIKKLRDALGDTAENPRFVETLPRRGYRFLAPVDGVTSASPEAASPITPSPDAATVSPTDKAARAKMLAPGTRLGPYEVLAPLGAGGMGQVYRARDARLAREVALKVLPPEVSTDPERLQRFEQEARAASALNHPNIITVYDMGRADSTSYIVMELVEGKTLRELLSSGPLPTRKLLQLAVQIADGLARAHAAGIVHRDLKPQNIMVTKSGVVKILDFGLAKLGHLEFPNPDETQTSTFAKTLGGVILGSVRYMSPEQASGQSVDFRSDQFSFGGLLYEMVTGKRAFQRATAVETLTAIIRTEPEPLTVLSPEAPSPLRWVIERCLAKDPEERYADTRDLARELHGILEHLSEAGVAREPAAAVRSPHARFRAALVIAAAVALSAGAYWLVERAQRPAVIVARQLTFRHGRVNEARFSPDGRTIVYSAMWDGKPVEVFTTTPEGPESRSLGLRDTGIFALSSAGELAIALGCQLSWGVCHGTLARVSLAGGAPRELLESVDTADWSPDGKALAVVRATEGKYRIEFPIGKVLYESPGWISEMRVSPKGGLIAFLEHPKLSYRAGWVAVVDLAGKKRVLSSGWKAALGLAWWPSGEEVWFDATRQGAGGNLMLYAVTLSGRVRPVFRAPASLVIHDISRDGRQVLLHRTTPRAGISSVSSVSGLERDLSWFDYSTTADLSADGKTLLFYEWGNATAGVPTVYLRSTQGSDAVRLGEGRALALSPDGKWALAVQETLPPRLALLPTGAGKQKILPIGAVNEIYWGAWFADGKQVMFAGEEPGHLPRTYVHDLERDTSFPVTPEGLIGVLISPDGKLFAAYGPDGNYYLYPVAGGEPRAIPGVREGEGPVQWSDDGRSLYVRERGDFAVTIYRVDLGTGRRELWKKLAPTDPVGIVGIAADPRGVQMTPDGKSVVYTYWRATGELYLIEGLK